VSLCSPDQPSLNLHSTNNLIIVRILMHMRRSHRARDNFEGGSSKEHGLSADVVARLLLFSSFSIVTIALVTYFLSAFYKLTLI
jgi:hypothetical protein